MPYKSKAQQRAMHAKADAGEIDPEVVAEFDKATKKQKGGFAALPERVKKEKKSNLRSAGASVCVHGLQLSHHE